MRKVVKSKCRNSRAHGNIIKSDLSSLETSSTLSLISLTGSDHCCCLSLVFSSGTRGWGAPWTCRSCSIGGQNVAILSSHWGIYVKDSTKGHWALESIRLLWVSTNVQIYICGLFCLSVWSMCSSPSSRVSKRWKIIRFYEKMNAIFGLFVAQTVSAVFVFVWKEFQEQGRPVRLI